MKFIKRLLILALICIILGVGTIFGFYLYVKPDLPDVAKLKNVELQTPMQVYSEDGKLISQFGEKRRIPLTLDEIPLLMREAFIATEDSRFYEHPGVDPIGIARAAFVVLTSGSARQGASTITQQLARNFFLTKQKKIMRKIKEAFIAIHIEKLLTKDQILDLYLNKIYLGYRAYGVGAAAQVYFGKTVDQLTLSEIAVIAGLPKAPSTMNPIYSIDRATTRRNVVLGRMLEEGYITKAQMDAARAEPIVSRYHGAEIQLYAPYVAERARAWMVDRYGAAAYEKGMKVYTTINSKLQLDAQQAAVNNLLNYDRRHGYRGPTAVLWKPGQPALNANQIVNKLQDQPIYGKLIPAVVTKVDGKTAAIVTKNGDIATIDWNGMKWARKFLSDSSQGPAPKKASDILTAGQQIWVQHNQNTVGDKKDSATVTTNQWLLSQVPAANTAFVAMSPDNGGILAMIGGFNYTQSKFNRATQSIRQVGSGIKPFIYSAAIEKGLTLATLINDAPITKWDKWQGKAWRPKNSDGKYGGPTRARIGLARSINVMAIRALRIAGLDFTIDYLTRFGFKRADLPRAEPIALGAGSLTPLELVQGYSVFVNGGYAVEPYLINKVDNNDDQLIYYADPAVVCNDACQAKNPQAKMQVAMATAVEDHKLDPSTDTTATTTAPSETDKPTPEDLEKVIPMPPVRYAPEVISEQNAFLVREMLTSNIWGEPGHSYGTGWRARVLKRHDIGGKTGTSNQAKDAWYTGFGPNIVATTWVGFDNFRRDLGRHEFGGTAAQPAWIDFMRQALKNTPEQEMQIPSDIVKVRIDRATGQLSNRNDASSMYEYFIKGTEPTRSVQQAVSEQKFDTETAEELF
ncbi:penicillin-binding protein 1A [Photobacterium angustum]|uniref:Penicillin-binding protein 1A n=1 Tax=Photobacterium angustum TaxID=661 RepID=A0A855SBW9_PHOAN|nr:PBP1A family penicillin-binding protein [Photobacterium angustum]KJF81336.1 penicillin-sensitive transpeptidase [Photobacterium damselae subsp. damselae]KJG01300.1 penicillin-sensitive transpeptidase [Photobacterium angustum]KJG36779.1 penicillin-sensitive transpeptidase [Photobacterium angustum]KJG40024.1 penicillin-sensitive transpeptidase [Photobacterium angustum]KJG44898.1 penicillin-sensitive transpeptidase [Photobacterium angustum]